MAQFLHEIKRSINMDKNKFFCIGGDNSKPAVRRSIGYGAILLLHRVELSQSALKKECLIEMTINREIALKA